MKRTFKNFNKLSAKQIKTYAAVIIMSVLSFEAFASASEEFVNSEPTMVSTVETSLDQEFAVESWMTKPFDISVDEEAAMEVQLTVETEAMFEMDIAIESWMTVPFAIESIEEAPVQNSMCTPAP